jgi:uncharacterized protein (DUF2141 family)
MKMTMTTMMIMTTTSILCLLALTVVVLQRLVSLESTVAELTRTVQQQQMQIGQLTNHVQESTSRSLQVMEDQACLLTFFNETGTPTCKVNYHLSAGKWCLCGVAAVRRTSDVEIGVESIAVVFVLLTLLVFLVIWSH